MLWTKAEKDFLLSLDDPYKIQSYLNSLDYNPEDSIASPRYVMLSGEAHCLEGALLAAAALELQGRPPLLVELQAHDYDDSHMLAVYKTATGWGSIAKSNLALIAGRYPVYRSIRELVMSYFDLYFDINGRPSLYAYTDPINLHRCGNVNWRTSDEDLIELGLSFTQLPHFELLSIEELEALPHAPERVRTSSFLGVNMNGLWKPLH